MRLVIETHQIRLVKSEELTREGVDHFGLSQAVNPAPVDPATFSQRNFIHFLFSRKIC